MAYDPITIDDEKAEKIYGYDSNGKLYVLDAQNEPDFPVIVLGINERVDPVTKQLKSEKCLGKPTWTYETKICSFRLLHDHEPWWKGDPEIYVKAKKYYQSNADFVRTDFTKVNKEKTYLEADYSWLPKNIYSFYSPVVQIRIEVWEDDSGNNDDLLEHEWCYPYPDSEASNYGPSGYKEWWYGDHRNANLKFKSAIL